MNANAVTYIIFVQDHSGSMKMHKRDELAISNFNEQRSTLLKEDDDTMDNIVTIVEFDDTIHCNIENMPISEIKELKKWWCGGMTALYDAIAYGINNVKQKMKADNRKDKAAIMIIQTDGDENYSSDYQGEEGRLAINKMINELEETGIWSFTFLGEGIDKAQVASMGFKMDNIMSHDLQGTEQAYDCSSAGLKKYMSMRKAGGTQTMSFYNDSSTGDEKNGPWTVNKSGDIK